MQIALRTQQVIAHESGVTNTVDPLGGSYFIDALTRHLEAEAYEYFRRIEEMGGVLPAIEAGFFQREIAESAYRYQREIDERRRIIVGVNEYVGTRTSASPSSRSTRRATSGRWRGWRRCGGSAITRRSGQR